MSKEEEMWKQRREKAEKLKLTEPHLHQSLGMMRVGEISLIAKVCKDYDIKTYIEFGCGPCHALKEIRSVCGDGIRLIGFEHIGIPEEIWKPLGIEFFQMGILEDKNWPTLNEKTLDIIEKIRASSGRTLFLTDNGYKVGELIGCAKVARPGDLLATHDYPSEVRDSAIQFLYTDEYRILNDVEEEIQDHAYFMRFWEKVK